MKNVADKWIVIRGHVFRLEKVFDDIYGALLLQKKLSAIRNIHLKRIDDGRWGLYWRSKKKSVVCTPDLKAVAQ